MAKTPRMNKYEALLARFFETTIVLSIINHIPGPRIQNRYDKSTSFASLREFLNNLAFILDYAKGGHTTTSVAVENKSDCYKFWVATNEGPSENVADFLGKVLKLLGSSPAPDPTDVAKICCDFAKERINKERRILTRFITKCEKDLKGKTFPEPDKASLTPWLQEVQRRMKSSPFQVCEFAFNIRNNPQMKTLAELGGESITYSKSPADKSPFLVVRHYIGRLAARIRAATQLVENSKRWPELIAVYEIGRVPLPDCVPPPKADDQTNIENILNRLVPPYAEMTLEDYKKLLPIVDAATGLNSKVTEIYAKETVKPRVHSEIQMLEMFHRNELKYAYDHRFIGTSKDACLCCLLYFQHHPARCALPDSHQKIYLNWGPILLPKGIKDRRFIEQRHVLGNVRSDLREIVLELIRNPQMTEKRREDSITEITQSEIDGRDDMDDFSDLEDELLSGDSNQDTLDASAGYDDGLNGDDDSASVWDDSDSDGGVKLTDEFE